MAGTKAILSMRQWCYLELGDEKAVEFVAMATPEVRARTSRCPVEGVTPFSLPVAPHVYPHPLFLICIALRSLLSLLALLVASLLL